SVGLRETKIELTSVRGDGWSQPGPCGRWSWERDDDRVTVNVMVQLQWYVVAVLSFQPLERPGDRWWHIKLTGERQAPFDGSLAPDVLFHRVFRRNPCSSCFAPTG